MPGEENKMTDTSSRLTFLHDQKFLSHFHTQFLQSKPWRLLLLLYAFRQQLTTILYSKQYLRASPPQYSRKTPPPGANGGAPESGCILSMTSKTIFYSSIFLLSASVPDFYLCRVSPSRSNRSNNTSACSVKYLHPWGPTNPAITNPLSPSYG